MKRRLLTFALAALTIGLLGSCSKINERIDNLEKRVDGIENNQIASIGEQIAAIKESINNLKAADETIGGKIGELTKTAEALQTLIDALKEADKALEQKDDALEARIATLEGQVAVINGQIKTLEDADKAINTRIDELKSYIDTELGKTKDWASATFATLTQYRQTATDLATLSVTVSGISTTLAEVQTSITTLDTKIDGIDAALQGKIAEAKTELEGKIADLKTELEGKITEAISTSETSLKGWVNEQLSAYYTAAQMDVKIAGLRSEIEALDSDNEANKTKIAELETKLDGLSAELAQAKATIKTEYEAAIQKAIKDYNGTITQPIQSKIDQVNTTITALTGRVETLETTVGVLSGRIDAAEANIATINQQIAAIKESISDLETIRANIQASIDAKNAMGEDITALKAADQALEVKINDLKTYVDTELAKYATTDWVNGTFATLEKQAEITAAIEKLQNDLADIDTKIARAIKDLETSLQGWVNEQLSAYCTTAQMEDRIAGLQSEINSLKGDNEENKAKIRNLEDNLNNLSAELADAKATIKAEYESAIQKAIEVNNGIITRTINDRIDEVNATITALEGRVSRLEDEVLRIWDEINALKAMIQSVSITPAYSDGSVEAVDGILTLKCIVSPAEALNGMESLNDCLLIYADSVKVKTKAASAYMEIKVSEAAVTDAAQGAITLKADIKEYLPKGADQTLTVALNVKNGISDFTTEFVPVYVYVAPAPAAPEGFVDLGVKDANGKPLYWAEKNLGASNPQDYGDYFAWGETAQYYTTTGGWPATPTWKPGRDSGYAWQSYCGQSSFVEWSTPPYDATSKILLPAYDAATKTNSSWRTPTSDEFKALAANCVWIWTANYNSTGKAGYIVYKAKNNADKGKANMNGTWKKWNGSSYSNDSAATGSYSIADTHIFFPAAGYGFDTSLNNEGSYGIYWSSIRTGNIDSAYSLFFYSDSVFPQYSTGSRSNGCSARPVTSGAAPAPAPLPAGALAGEFTVANGKKVHFSKGNLVATINATGTPTAWKFATNQYDYIGELGANKAIGGSAGDIDLFGWSTDAKSNNWGIHTKTTSTKDYTTGNFKDWGIAIDGKGTWRTLSIDEWTYLFSTRTMTNDKSRYSNAVNGVTIGGTTYKGVFIYPDNYNGDVVSSSMTWDQINAAGIVFLPAAGNRSGYNVSNVGSRGVYWSSSAYDDSHTNRVNLTSSSVTLTGRDGRNLGISVRLITDVK